MLRSAAKNYRDVIVLTDPADYPLAVDELKKSGNEGTSDSANFRRRLAGKVFNLTSAYDAAVSRYLLDEDFPSYYPLSLAKNRNSGTGKTGIKRRPSTSTRIAGGPWGPWNSYRERS